MRNWSVLMAVVMVLVLLLACGAPAEPTPTPAPEPAPAPEPVPEPKPEPKSRIKRKPKPKARSKPKTKPEPIPETGSEAEPEMVSEPVPESEPEPVPVPGPEPETSSTAIEVTVEELNLAYQEDKVAANAKFTNRILRVTGSVDKVVVRDYLDIAYVLLAGAVTLKWNVRCTFEKQYSSQLNRLTQGQVVTVQGEYGGYERNIIMKNCVVAS